MKTLLFHSVPYGSGMAAVVVNLFYLAGECEPQRYMVHTSTDAGETNVAHLYRTQRAAAAAWLDAITKAEHTVARMV